MTNLRAWGEPENSSHKKQLPEPSLHPQVEVSRPSDCILQKMTKVKTCIAILMHKKAHAVNSLFLKLRHKPTPRHQGCKPAAGSQLPDTNICCDQSSHDKTAAIHCIQLPTMFCCNNTLGPLCWHQQCLHWQVRGVLASRGYTTSYPMAAELGG